MKILVRLGVAAGLGLLVAFGPSIPARAQVGVIAPNANGGDEVFWTLNRGAVQAPRIPPQGLWAQVISATSKWIVIQNEEGQQFPIASERVRRFFIRWPSSVDQLTPGSMVEATGPEGGSNSILADHFDVYEGDAQSLVTPTIQSSYGSNRPLTAYDLAQQNSSFGVFYWTSPDTFSMPAQLHVVGNPVGVDPVRVSIYGQNSVMIQPGVNGMTVTQVTLGSNSYARAGDLVFIVPENVGLRSLDVSQLVLYKKMPLRMFQP